MLLPASSGGEFGLFAPPFAPPPVCLSRSFTSASPIASVAARDATPAGDLLVNAASAFNACLDVSLAPPPPLLALPGRLPDGDDASDDAVAVASAVAMVSLYTAAAAALASGSILESRHDRCASTSEGVTCAPPSCRSNIVTRSASSAVDGAHDGDDRTPR